MNETVTDKQLLSKLTPESLKRLKELSFLCWLHVQEIDRSMARLQKSSRELNSIFEMEFHNEGNNRLLAETEMFSILRDMAERFSEISRVFFPSPSRSRRHLGGEETKEEFAQRKIITKSRASILKELFDIEEKETIANILVRNRLVHMDEDLDLLFLRKKGKPFIRTLTAPISDGVDGVDESEILERFDADEMVYYVQGHPFKLNEVKLVANEVNSKMRNIGPFLIRQLGLNKAISK